MHVQGMRYTFPNNNASSIIFNLSSLKAVIGDMKDMGRVQAEMDGKEVIDISWKAGREMTKKIDAMREIVTQMPEVALSAASKLPVWLSEIEATGLLDDDQRRSLKGKMESNSQHLHGACHCGAVRFEVRLSDGLNTARRCNCSYCRMRGAIAVSADLRDIAITSGEQLLTLYQFNSMEAKHYFCSKCGIYTHHQRRSNPDQYGVNVACLEGVSPFDFAEVPVNEGRTHPKDLGAGGVSSIAGYLRYFPNTAR